MASIFNNIDYLLNRKTKIEKGLDEQKKEISEVIQKYSSFIEKLMKDKKDLSEKCEHYSQKLLEKENEFAKYKAWVQERMQEMNKDSKNQSNMSIEDEHQIDCKKNKIINSF